MSDNSDISDFESTVDDLLDEEPSNSSSSSSSSSSSDESGTEDLEVTDSMKVSTTRNKSFQRKAKDDGARITRKVKYVYSPKPGEKDERISPFRMTEFEYAALIGERTEMISRGAKIHPTYANYPTVDLERIARMELDDRTIPFPLMLKRPIDHPTHPTLVEIFNVREISLPDQRLTNYIEKYLPVNTWRVFE